MPTSVIIAAAASYAGAATAAYFGGAAVLGAFGAAAVSAGASFVVGGALNSALGINRQPTQDFAASAAGRDQVVRSGVANRTVVYGRAMVSGPLVFAASSDDADLDPMMAQIAEILSSGETSMNMTAIIAAAVAAQAAAASSGNGNAKLHLVIPLAGHEIDAVEAVYFNDVLLGERDALGNVTSGDFAGVAAVRVHLGTPGDPADAGLIAASVGWTTAHKLAGVAYLVVELIWSQDKFPTGIPNIKAQVRGKKIYDPRSATVGWSANFALCVRDYLTSAYGLECGSDELDEASFIAGANIADEAIALAGGGTEARYACHGVVDLGQTPRSIMEGLLSSGAGFLVWSGGQYRLHAGAYTAPAVTLTADDLRDSVKVRPRIARRELFNAVRGTYVDPDKYWQPGDFPPVSNATYAAQDGGQVIWRDVALPFTTSGATAQRIAKLMLERSRQGITVEFPAKLTAFKVATLDTVMITLAQLGWSAKEFKVLEWKFSADGGVDLMLQEETAASYAWNSGLETVIDPAPDTSLHDPFTVPPLQGLSLLAGTDEQLVMGDGTIVSRIKLAWSMPADVYTQRGKVEIQARLTAATEWVSQSPAEASLLSAWIAPVQDGVEYQVRARFINGAGIQGAWTQSSATVAVNTLKASLTGISATETLVVAAGAVVPKVQVTWTASSNYSHARLAWRLDGGAWTTLPDIYGTSAALILPVGGQLDIDITPWGTAPGQTVRHTASVAGKTALPANVAGLAINLAGRQALLSWNPSTDLDVLVGGWLWVRHSPVMSGASWGNATDLLPSVPGTATSAAVPLKSGTYLARWVDSSANLSATAAALVVDASVIAQLNVVVAQDEHPAWSGSKTNMTVNTGALQLTNPALAGAYRAATIDLGAVHPARISADLHFAGFAVSDMIDARAALIDTWADIAGALVEDVAAEVWFSATADDPAGAAVWTAWSPLRVATDYAARAYRFEARCASSTPEHNVSIDALTLSVDVDDRTEAGAGIVSGAGPKSVTFSRPFFALPALGFTLHDGASGDWYELTKTLTGFTVTFRNAGGTAVSRTFDWSAKGY